MAALRPVPLRRVAVWLLAAALVSVPQLGCSSKKEPPLKVVNGRTILMDSSDPAPPEAAARARKRQPDLVTRADDRRVGKEASEGVASQMGLLGDPGLDAYVDEIGERLLRGLPRRSFGYSFQVVDQFEPNAFALPGGYIFISRGLLALVNTEDELANVIGHEITHAARRHSARAQAADQFQSPLTLGWIRAAKQASYSRDMEREADEGGQILAAAAGYDPRAMASVQSSLGQFQRLMTGRIRYATFFDTHPGSGERAVATSLRAAEMRWKRDPSLGDGRASLLREIEGLPVGERPQAGVFRGQRFLHPDLDFQIRFPDGWVTLNTPQAVGAQSRRRDAAIFLTAGGPAMPPHEAAEKWIAEAAAEAVPGEPRGSAPIKLAGVDGGEAHRAQVYQSNGRIGLLSTATFFNHGETSLAIISMALSQVADGIEGRYLATTRSFRRMTPEQMRGFEEQRIHVVEARGGESVEALVQRTGSIWNRNQVAVVNAKTATGSFEAGERVKIALSRPYTPSGGSSLGGGPRAIHELAAAFLGSAMPSASPSLEAGDEAALRARLLERALSSVSHSHGAEAEVGQQAALGAEGRVAN
ncbi:MAG: M48 family metalloprotease [Myxococcota bacterium]|nr:M48 family metalloprotease [Myxococcota bacterium]